MPELAEVEHYRRKWDIHRDEPILRVFANSTKRVLRGIDTAALSTAIVGAPLRDSASHGKQMLFRFGETAWLGVHLGMTGALRSTGREHTPGPHEHLILWTATNAMIFTDPRLFGRILFHEGTSAPEWWNRLPPSLNSDAFTLELVALHLKRRAGSPLKGLLLMQDFFPGIGNWMADEILWRAGILPSAKCGALCERQVEALHRETRFVVAGALKSIPGETDRFGDPPDGWFYHARWEDGGRCPKDLTELNRDTVAGRTTAWCPVCQGL